MATGTQKVVTYQSPSGHRVKICSDCERRLKAAGQWAHDANGSECCHVYMGLTYGECSLCPTDSYSAADAASDHNIF